VEAHGGRIWAENNSDGMGATFSFSLPMTQWKQSKNKRLCQSRVKIGNFEHSIT
jgi:K+-sensing histidine kinase KdpD